jgi:hypothetical protein
VTEILGRPIVGDVTSGGKRYRIEQWDEERLLADIDAVFAADPRIAAINWRQYTPYFNDGDPCEFSCYLNDDGVVALDKVPTYWAWDEATGEDDEEIETRTTSYYSGKELVWNEENNKWDWVEIALSDERDKAMQTLIENWQHYEDVCREHFGEHSQVIATREGFQVEFYEHD